MASDIAVKDSKEVATTTIASNLGSTGWMGFTAQVRYCTELDDYRTNLEDLSLADCSEKSLLQ